MFIYLGDGADLPPGEAGAGLPQEGHEQGGGARSSQHNYYFFKIKSTGWEYLEPKVHRGMTSAHPFGCVEVIPRWTLGSSHSHPVDLNLKKRLLPFKSRNGNQREEGTGVSDQGKGRKD